MVVDVAVLLNPPAVAEAVTFGTGFTVTVEVAVPVLHPLVPVTVYVVVVDGLAVTLEPVVELSPVGGDQE